MTVDDLELVARQIGRRPRAFRRVAVRCPWGRPAISEQEPFDDRGLTEEALLSTLTAEADPTRPIKVIGVALGPDADLSALERIAEATDGAAYSAVDPTDLQTVLFDALRQRD